MSLPARQVRICGHGEYRDQAEACLKAPGDASLVQRGVLRSFVMKCPDGCGETLVVNLDPRSGKAWRLDQRSGVPTLYPSVWKEGGCESHFIIWRGRILWCDRWEDGNLEPPYDATLEARVLPLYDTKQFRSAADVAFAIDEIPWEVSRASIRLSLRGLLERGPDHRRDWFRKR